MKRIFLLTCLISLFSLSFQDTQKRNHVSMNYQHKFEISVYAKGNGHSGNVAVMKIKNLTSVAQTLFIPPGSQMQNTDTSFQDLFIPNPVMVHMNARQTLTVNLNAYCCKLRGKSPQSSNSFVFKPEATNKKLVEFARFMDLHRDTLNHNLIQSMTWCLSDLQNPAGIPVYAEEHMKYKKWICDAMGIPLPWYFIKQKNFTLRDGRIQLLNDSLIGTVEADAIKSGYEKFIIINESGQEVYYTQVHPVHAGKNQIPFRIKITQWPKGKYYLASQNGSNTNVQKLIEI
ncbi:MAG: hypothetical protein N3F09_02505 [Bacteroidia bacterium]|nr:hypothetical protein [Bacteroidia bacterium]